MGMAASQARLLTITARLHDVEYQAQTIQNAKLMLATQSDEVYQEYLNALDATTFTVKSSDGNIIPANFNTLCGIDAAKASSKERYLLRDDRSRVIVSDDVARGYESFDGNNAYEFAMYMMTGQPSDFDSSDYSDAEDEIFAAKDNANNLTSSLSSLKEDLSVKILSLIDLIPEEAKAGNYTNVESVKENILGAKSFAYDVFRGDKSNADMEDNEYMELVNANREKATELMETIDKLYESFEFQMYSTYAEEIYEKSGNNKNDFDSEDFWYYANIYKQIEANGGSYTTISTFDGIDGIGNASTDSDWLQNMVQSGKITIDVSTVDSKTGAVSFSSTSVASDSSLEYTTTSTIDKKALAKAEAEYEHKTKEIDRKDKKFDMELSKLETERTALTTEYESVKKVAKDNIERSFGIFS